MSDSNASELADAMIAPIEAWAGAVDDADIVSGPQDFLVAYGAACRSIERLLETEDRAHARGLLTALATCEFVMAEHPEWTDEVGLPPIQPLPAEWLVAVDDDSAEFRLAASLNSLRPIGFEDREATLIGPFRAHLELIDYRWQRQGPRAGSTAVSWNFTRGAEVDWDRQEDVDGLNAIFTHRLKRWTATPDSFVRGAAHAPLADVHAFLAGQTDEAKLSRLCFELSLVEAWRVGENPLFDAEESSPDGLDTAVDPVFALARLCYSGLTADEGPPLPLNRDIHLLAARGDLESTVEFARAHLRKHGFEVEADEIQTELDVRRIAAALLFPLSDEALEGLFART